MAGHYARAFVRRLRGEPRGGLPEPAAGPVYVYHHLGLGDHLICNGLVREVVRRSPGQVFLVVKEHNLENVALMYRDLGERLAFLVGDDAFAEERLRAVPASNAVKIGFERRDEDVEFDVAFYRQFGLPIRRRFEWFRYERDREREERTYHALNPADEPYVFIHEDPSRGYRLDRRYLPDRGLKVISSSHPFAARVEWKLFDYLAILERAREVHVMESSFKALIDSCLPRKEGLFLHVYVKGRGTATCSSSNAHWRRLFGWPPFDPLLALLGR